uniref:Ubiquitin-like protease family profile domain-containing protein n=2 Tax=Cacopsylla melanoneura TaxID=428564 RepID=A0A8D9A7M9_9HEMI
MVKKYFTNDQFFKVPLFVPFNYQQNHFTLMILDFHRREFVYLDPFTVNYQSTKQTVMLMRNTLDIIKQIINLNCEVTYELHIEEWKIGNKKYTHLPAQRDTYNCGVYTIYYARKIIETLKSLPSEFEVTNSDPKICEKLRPILIEKVLEVSDSIRDRCILCLTKKSGTFVECGRCRNWFHVHCLPSECKRRYKKTKQNTHFLCGLCFRK